MGLWSDDGCQGFNERKADVLRVLVVGRDEADVAVPEGVDRPSKHRRDGLGIPSPRIAIGLGPRYGAASGDGTHDGFWLLSLRVVHVVLVR